MDSKILIGTGNPHKVALLQRILKQAGYDSVTLAEVFRGDIPEIHENGKTFQENAEIKAANLSKLYEGYVVATDGGVAIPGLGDNWNGLYTRRFAGEHATDDERIAKLLKLADGLPDSKRAMLWQEAIAIAKNGRVLSSQLYDGAKGTLEYEYDPKKYMPGIWVCSLWYVDDYKKHFFDMTPEERDASNVSWQQIGKHIKHFFAQAQ